MHQTLQTALDGLAQTLGLDRLTLSSDGETAISIDDVEIGITLVQSTGQVRFLSIIGDMPETDGPELGQLLLAANHQGAMTGGAAIGYDAEADILTLNLCLPVAGISPEILAAALEVMANVTTGWRSNLPVLAEIDATAAPAAASGDEGSGWVRV